MAKALASVSHSHSCFAAATNEEIAWVEALPINPRNLSVGARLHSGDQESKQPRGAGKVVVMASREQWKLHGFGVRKIQP